MRLCGLFRSCRKLQKRIFKKKNPTRHAFCCNPEMQDVESRRAVEVAVLSALEVGRSMPSGQNKGLLKHYPQDTSLTTQFLSALELSSHSLNSRSETGGSISSPPRQHSAAPVCVVRSKSFRRLNLTSYKSDQRASCAAAQSQAQFKRPITCRPGFAFENHCVQGR
ncbi:hypothetical protein VTN77DRAFT_3653 [Rasamsonia byssochlamydoides]|uniref:uncharacterized protein n=1 Tax=Rasamsonia byssochlamydoides TaxID=89139 RepID=UPI00374360E6